MKEGNGGGDGGGVGRLLLRYFSILVGVPLVKPGGARTWKRSRLNVLPDNVSSLERCKPVPQLQAAK